MTIWKKLSKKTTYLPKKTMKITTKEVELVALLARLDLSQDELIVMTGQLDNILSYIEKLKEVNTENISATSHVFAISNAFREDTAGQSLTREDVLRNAPEKNEEMFKVPKVI
jgi:aspartyl-tRNA(Asn)/glutamyl-tRNA(Gln) amidotransferase subunit C